MAVETPPLFAFESSFARELEELHIPWEVRGWRAPELLVLNEELARELGADPEALRSPAALGVFLGHPAPPGSTPVAMAYAGHQFGGYSPRLGDGRALLVGEVLDVHGRRRDLHLKGSGRTPFARGGDGKAAVGPMLREYVVSEAMHALGIPTTRALAVVATGEEVVRETALPGAVLTRVAASHIRVGTFQYAAGHPDPALVRRLADYSIARHHPAAAEADNPYLAFYEAVVAAQAALVARWMLAGFIHGVMNTDNMTISGETIDYGPCAFMDAFDVATVFSSIDHGRRYAYGNQPIIAQWNLARLAEAIVPLIDADTDTAVAAASEVLRSFAERYNDAWRAGMSEKLGLAESPADDPTLFEDLLALMQAQRVDYTAGMRALSSVARRDAAAADALFAADPEAFDGWATRWLAHLPGDRAAAAAAMDRANPVYVPRNHLVEAALSAATDGDLVPFERLLDVVTRPFDERPGLQAYAQPAPEDFGPYRTFCGT